ncbi:hypothetical protein SAMN04488128_1021402 [Chitinophaga eiseniae]|uniref:Uncharacterized protein n=1 Tax=Chitinophaga eiseniae TaxID=634771 RepID=A0A1T4RQK3_9BACT|nr:hypothetical protein [Chitinophaga eiseniae]SKA18280.1 hypothetical protein SAMN04488128_1021402 [Chitinophaga eiseniae]
MSLLSFQQALAALIASPELCVEARQQPDAVFASYDLTDRERKRLESVVFQRGMSVNCTLYRVNRITPIYTLLPYTCLLLGNRLMPLATAFWEACRQSDLQFKREIEGFADYLEQQIIQGRLQVLYLPEILRMETAINALKFLPKQQDAALKVRYIPFEHEPGPLLEALSALRLPEVRPAVGNWLLIIDYSGEEMFFSTTSTFEAS